MSLRHLDNLPANLLLDLDEALDLSAYFTNQPLDRFVAAAEWGTDMLEANEATHAAPASRENTPTLATPAVLQSTLLSR